MSAAEGKIKVLVVDDEIDLCEVMEALIEDSSKSIECNTCYSGMDALNALGRKKYDIVVTDIKMPGMNGVELIKQIRSQHMPSPLLYAITGFTDFDNSEILGAGAEEVFKKPCDLAILVESVNVASREMLLDR